MLASRVPMSKTKSQPLRFRASVRLVKMKNLNFAYQMTSWSLRPVSSNSHVVPTAALRPRPMIAIP